MAQSPKKVCDQHHNRIGKTDSLNIYLQSWIFFVNCILQKNINKVSMIESQM